MSAEEQLHARIKAFLDKNYPCCGVAGCCGEEEEAWAIIDIVKAAGFGLVAEAGAKALEDAADRVMGPSDVLLDGATCRWIAMELRERAAAVRTTNAHD